MRSEIPVSDYASRKLNLRHSHKRDEVVTHEGAGLAFTWWPWRTGMNTDHGSMWLASSILTGWRSQTEAAHLTPCPGAWVRAASGWVNKKETSSLPRHWPSIALEKSDLGDCRHVAPVCYFSRHIWRKYFDQRRHKQALHITLPTENIPNDLDSFFGFRAGMMVAIQTILPEFNFI